MEKLCDYIKTLKKGDAFWIKSNVGIRDVYHKWEIKEIKDRQFYDDYKLYNSKHGFNNFIIQNDNSYWERHPDSDSHLVIDAYNKSFKITNDNKYDDYYDYLTNDDFVKLNQKERDRHASNYIQFCKDNGEIPNISESDLDKIYLSAIY